MEDIDDGFKEYVFYAGVSLGYVIGSINVQAPEEGLLIRNPRQ